MKLKEYRFLDGVALKYGVEEAIFLNNLFFWINKNKENGLNQRNGKTWMYMTANQFLELFPFWNLTKIYRIGSRLEEKNVIVRSKSLNKHKYDRTYWYSFSDFAKWKLIFENKEFPDLEMEVANSEIGIDDNEISNNQSEAAIQDSIINIDINKINIKNIDIKKDNIIQDSTTILYNNKKENFTQNAQEEKLYKIDELIGDLNDLLFSKEYTEKNKAELQSILSSNSYNEYINLISNARLNELMKFCNEKTYINGISPMAIIGLIKNESKTENERLYCTFNTCYNIVYNYLQKQGQINSQSK